MAESADEFGAEEVDGGATQPDSGPESDLSGDGIRTAIPQSDEVVDVAGSDDAVDVREFDDAVDVAESDDAVDVAESDDVVDVAESDDAVDVREFDDAVDVREFDGAVDVRESDDVVEVAESGRGERAAAPTVQQTGDPRVDDALARLADLGDLPLAAQVTVFDDVHRLLQDALTASDSGAAPGAPAQ